MKIIILTITTTLFFSFISKTFSQDTIHWKPYYKLKWEDFQGIPDTTSKFRAISSIGINYTLTFNKKAFSYNVTCIFNKKESWTKSKDSTLLEHENTHFNIAELFARKLNQVYKNYKFPSTTIRNDFEKTARVIKTERNKVDDLYDKETNFSRNKKKQNYWNNRIKTELKKIQIY
jgi:hypothetical protein